MLVGVLGDGAGGPEHLGNLLRRGLDPRCGIERVLRRQRALERLMDLRGPQAVQLGLGGTHDDGEGLDERADQQGAQSGPCRVGHAEQHLLVDEAQRIGKLGVRTFQRARHELARSGPGIAMRLDLVECRPHLA